MDGSDKITRLLRELRDGQKTAEADLAEAVYPQLRLIALRCLRTERPGHTLQATALVNEAYLQLAGQDKDWQNRTHFYAVAARVMRRILVDYARERRAQKRDGNRLRVELTDALAITESRLDEVIEIDTALHRLTLLAPRQSRVVELRFFGGLTEEEIANILGVATRTVKRDWTMAKAWLYGELTQEPT